jgi:mono/diheme cytochrome c family protein
MSRFGLALFVVLLGLFVVLLGCQVGCQKKEDTTAQARDLFAGTCARCHGPDGTGGVPLFDGGPSPRNFHDHSFHAARTDEQIKQTIVNGKGTGMPAFGATFNDAQLNALVAYVRGFDAEKGTK